ncbi:hypothetical protein LLEC1_05505, partial [Akanthomyces lecanii]
MRVPGLSVYADNREACGKTARTEAHAAPAGAVIPRGLVARSPEEARAAVEQLGNNSLLSAQLLKRNVSLAEQEATGLVAGSPEQAAKLAANLLRASDGGIAAKELYISQPTPHDQVWYLAMTIDRETYRPTIVVSKHGGQDIRTIARQHPASIRSYNFTLTKGIPESLTQRIASDLGISSTAETISLGKTLTSLHRIFLDKEGMLLEVRSLARCDGALVCLDSSF